MEDLHRRCIGMEDLPLHELGVQDVVDRPESVGRRIDDPVGQGLPGQVDSQPVPFLRLAVDGQPLGVLLVEREG